MKRNAVKGILCDLDGVLFVGESAIPGAVETILELKRRDIKLRFITNTTTKHCTSIKRMLNGLGFDIGEEEILTTPGVAADYLRQRNLTSCWPVVAEDVEAEFRDFIITENNPQCIIIGDIGPKWDYALMNKLFAMVMNGSEIIALHKGKSWRTSDGLQLDIGAFVAGLEYAAGKEAAVIGKPSELYYQLAVKAIGLPKTELVMIGDDIENDVKGAQDAGIPGILVKTGKYHSGYAEASGVMPDATIDSIAGIWDVIV